MLFTSTTTNIKFAGNYDKFGDSYFEDVTPDRLGEIFKNMDGKVRIATWR